ncbi:MAG: hypothetical protein ACFFCE_15520 [Promethearchaeota archaeon]
MPIIEEKDEEKNQIKEYTTEELTNIMIESVMAKIVEPGCCEAKYNRLQKESEKILKKKDEIKKNGD